jgi:putative transposase
MILAHKIELQPNNKQRTYFTKASGTARFAYNWALDQWQTQYQAHKNNPDLPKPSQGELRKQLNAIKRDEFPWMDALNRIRIPNLGWVRLRESLRFNGKILSATISR